MEGAPGRKRDAAGFAEGSKNLVELGKVRKEALVRESRIFVERAFSERRLWTKWNISI